MNKKEIAEIKKQLTPENCALTRLCACYVDGEKNKKTEMKEAFSPSRRRNALNILRFSERACRGQWGKT